MDMYMSFYVDYSICYYVSLLSMIACLISSCYIMPCNSVNRLVRNQESISLLNCVELV